MRKKLKEDTQHSRQATQAGKFIKVILTLTRCKSRLARGRGCRERDREREKGGVHTEVRELCALGFVFLSFTDSS